MLRFAPALAALGVCALSLPVSAADYGELPDTFRSSFPTDWNNGDELDPLGFEFGLRYWYSLGAQQHNVGSRSYSEDDTSQILEGHFRIDDYSTNTYLKGIGGMAVVIDGTHSGFTGAGNIVDGKIGYAGFDLGSYAFGTPDDGVGVGFFGGYQYWHDSPNTGRANFTTATSASDVNWSTTSTNWSVPGDSEPNDIDIHALRLGLTAKADFGMFDINAEVAAIPYAWVSGTLGVDGFSSYSSGSTTYMKSSATSVEGWGYGAAAELLVGFHPTDNMTIRVGGRAWYLQGQLDAEYSVAGVTDQVDSDTDGTYEVAPGFSNQNYISTGNPFSLFRYGALIELTYAF